MRTVRRITALVVLALLTLTATAGASNPPSLNTEGQTAQGAIGRDLSDAGVGGWSNTTPGILGRPYIVSMTVTNGATTKDVIVAGSANAGNSYRPLLATNSSVISDVYPFVMPTNACKTGQAPADGVCYAAPNRVTIQIAHYVGGGNGWGGGDLSTTGLSFSNATGTATNPQITDTSVIDMVIGFHANYNTLGWTWLNGVPSFWNVAVDPINGNQVHVKFTPKAQPWTGGLPNNCTTIPVSSCGDNSTASQADILMPQIILSMDTTLPPIFSGALFATSGAVIGSLDASTAAGQIPQLSYGVAAPHLMSDGTTARVGTLYAVVPNSILTLFSTSAALFDSSLLPITRQGDTGTFTPSWSRWTTGTNGTDAQLLTISNISFSSPTFVVGRQSSNGSGGSGGGNGGNGSSNTGSGSGSGGNGNRVKLGSTTKIATLIKALNLKTNGGKTSVTTSTPKVCTATKGGIKAIGVGTCKATVTVKPKTGKPTKKNITLVVTKTGKRLPVSLHR